MRERGGVPSTGAELAPSTPGSSGRGPSDGIVCGRWLSSVGSTAATASTGSDGAATESAMPPADPRPLSVHGPPPYRSVEAEPSSACWTKSSTVPRSRSWTGPSKLPPRVPPSIWLAHHRLTATGLERMLGPGADIGGDVSHFIEACSCQVCGHENPAGRTRWCGVCGAELPAARSAPSRGTGREELPPARHPLTNGDRVTVATSRRWRASGPFRLAVPVLVSTALISAVVFTSGRDRLAEPAAEPDDDVELPASGALASPSDAGDHEAVDPAPEPFGTVRDFAAGALVWADRVTTEPRSPTSDLEVADGLIITAERSPDVAEDAIAVDVFAVDAMTGEQVWKRTVTAPRSPPTAPSLTVAGRWVVSADCAQLTGLALADGEVAWQHRTDQVIRLNDVAAAPRDDPEVILVATSNRTHPRLDWAVAAIDVVTGEIRWERDVVRAAVTADAAVVLDEDGRVSGLAAATGEPIWQVPHDDPPTELYPVAGAVLEVDDGDRTRGRLRAADDGRLLLDDEVHRHGLLIPGRNEVERRIEVVTTATEVALVEDGAVRWVAPQPQAGCCVSSHVLPDGAVAVLLEDDTLLHLDRDRGAALSDRDVSDLQESNSTLAGRFVVASDEPIRDRAAPLRFFDTADPAGWPVVATLSEAQVAAVLPEGDVLLLANDRLHRLTSP